MCFAVYILDPVHDIVYHTVSQNLPAKWVRWLDAPAPLTPASSGDDAAAASAGPGGAGDLGFERVPEEIREIVEGGGVDPREWVSEWVGRGARPGHRSRGSALCRQAHGRRRGRRRIGRGQRKSAETIIQEGGGEAARAGLI